MNTIESSRPASYTPGMRIGLGAVVAVSLFAGGCEKAGPKASGKLTDDEASLMSRLPNKVGLAFGGNLPRLQAHLAKSPLMKFSRAMETAKGQNDWQDCLGEKKFKQMIGVVDVRSGFEMRFLMTGLGMEDLEDCAKQAKIEHKVDSDRKFIIIEAETEAGKAKLPYLLLDDGAIYGRFKVGMSMLTPKFEEPSRATMEADITAAKSDSAVNNDKLIATMEKADRQKGVWFAGSAEGTMIGDQVHEMFGTLDLEGGLEIEATVEFADPKLSAKVMDSVEQARDAGGMLGSDIKRVIDALEVKKDGDRIRFGLKVTNAQLDSVFDKLAPMMPGGGMGRKNRRPQLEQE